MATIPVRVERDALRIMRSALERKLADRLMGELPPKTEEGADGYLIPRPGYGEPGFRAFYESLSDRDIVSATLYNAAGAVDAAPENKCGLPAIDQWSGPEVERLRQQMGRLLAGPWRDVLIHEHDQLQSAIEQAEKRWRKSVVRHAELIRAGQIEDAKAVAAVMLEEAAS